MDPVLRSFLDGLPAVAGHFAVTAVLLVAGAALYARLTPHRELDLIRRGNVAAALSFAGAVVGLAIPLAASMASSFMLLEVAVWGVFALVGQLLAYFVVDRTFRDLPRRITEGELAAAIVLVGLKLAVALIAAASLTS
jgi:putative membrane protein